MTVQGNAMIHSSVFLDGLEGLRNSTHGVGASPDQAYQVLGQNGFGDLPAQAASSQDPELLRQSDSMLDGIIESVSGENACSWLVRLIWPIAQRRFDGGAEQPGDDALLMDACRMAAHVFLHCTDPSLLSNRVAYLFLVGGYGEAIDLMLPFTSIRFDMDSFSTAVRELRASSSKLSVPDRPGTAVSRSAAALQATDADALANRDDKNFDAEDTDVLVKSDAAEAMPGVTRQYVFDVERCERACSAIVNDADADRESNSTDFLDRVDRTMTLFHSLAGAAALAPAMKQALYQRDALMMQEVFATVHSYRDIVREHGLPALPLMVMETATQMLPSQGGWEQTVTALGMIRDAGADMAAVMLARIPNCAEARKSGSRLLALDL